MLIAVVFELGSAPSGSRVGFRVQDSCFGGLGFASGCSGPDF